MAVGYRLQAGGWFTNNLLVVYNLLAVGLQSICGWVQTRCDTVDIIRGDAQEHKSGVIVVKTKQEKQITEVPSHCRSI